MVSPLEESLRTISRQTEKAARPRDSGERSQPGIVEGLPLAEASAGARGAELPADLPRDDRRGRKLGQPCRRSPTAWPDLLEKQAQVRSKILVRAGLSGGADSLEFAISVVTGLMIKVVPKVVEQFDNASVQLPTLTRLVIGGLAVSSPTGGGGTAARGRWGAGRGAVTSSALRNPAFRLRCDADAAAPAVRSAA